MRTEVVRQAPPLPAAAEPAFLAASARADSWPHTTRILPWALASFLAMIWLIPFDATVVPIPLPVDSLIDRFALVALALIWITTALGSQPIGPRHIRSPINVAIILFLIAITLSVILNFTVLARLDELDVAVKKLTLAFSFALFFYIVATTVRRSEIEAFVGLTLVLACVTAVGTIVEYRTGINHFFQLTSQIIPGVIVGPELADPLFGRKSITGPTGHGLAIAAILAMALPFAVMRASDASRNSQRVLYGLMVALILTGGMATLRKTAVIAPAVALLVLTYHRPRAMMRLLPLGLAVVIAMQLFAPGAISGVRYQLAGGSEASYSTKGRTDDYKAISFDLAVHPILGRGYGTYDPTIHGLANTPQRHRVLDNMLLVLFVEIGIIGVAAYLAVCLTAMVSLRRRALAHPARGANLAVATISALAVYLVSNVLFDTLAFPHVPYVLFFLLGLAAVLVRHDAQDVSHMGLNGRNLLISPGGSSR